MKKHILVTGSHRSGSTWTGRVLTSGNGVVYIDEPFNLNKKKKHKTPLKYWFELVSDQDDYARQLEFKRYLDQELCDTHKAFIEKVLSAGNPKSSLKTLKKYYPRLKAKRKLVKDPIALFSAEWLAKQYNMDVLVLLRHPAAFADSLKRAGWKHDFSHFLDQGKLMWKAIEPFKKDVIHFMKPPERQEDLIEHAILLWNIIYHRVAEYRNAHKDWLFMKHEDLSTQPFETFGLIFEKFDIPFDANVKQFLKRTTQAEESSKIERDSQKNAGKWKKNLSPNEIDRIYKATYNVASQFYNDEEWFFEKKS